MIKSNFKKDKIFFLFIGIWILISTLVVFIIEIIYIKARDQYIRPAGIDFRYFFGHFSPFIFFTYQSNFMLCVACFLIYRKFSSKIQRLYFAFTSLITITFLVYWALLSWNGKTWQSADTAIKSLITHLINPILGFIGLFLIRKSIIVDKALFLRSAFYVFGYFVFALIIYLLSYGKYQIKTETSTVTIWDGGTIYSFLNFKKPLFYKDGNIGIVVILDIVMFLIALFIPFVCAYFWKWVFRIQMTQEPFFKKKK